MVTDFGVAKALSAATQGPSDELTSIGMALGTPAYMAPEQVAGDPHVDHRADIYAFGIIAYELLTGRPPFVGRPLQSLMAAHVMEAPEPITNRRLGMPPALASLVMRCLEKQPGDRPRTADEILRELDNVSILRAGERDSRPSLAVVPMVNTSGDPDNEHFSDGLTDELIGALSRVAELTVSGRTSVFALKGKGLSIRAIAETLRVANVLEGSVRRAGNRLKVSVQLVDANGSVLWSESYDRMLTDVFAVQEEIAQAVVAALEVRLGTARGPLIRPPTASLTAYDLFLKGRSMRRSFTPDNLSQAIAYFEQAVARDPSFATAYAWLSDACVLRVVIAGRPAREEMARAREYARKAVALDPALADAHWALGQVFFCFDWNWTEADRAFQRAIELDPGHVDARHMYGISLLHQGRFEEARAEVTRALDTDPLLAEARGTLGRISISMRQLAPALETLRKAVATTPTAATWRAALGLLCVLLGKHAEGLAECHRAAEMGSPRELAMLACANAMAGRRADAESIVSDLLGRDGVGDAPPYHMAMVYAALDRRDDALRWLERAADELDPWVSALNIDPAFDALRADPRFRHLVQRIGVDRQASA